MYHPPNLHYAGPFSIVPLAKGDIEHSEDKNVPSVGVHLRLSELNR